LPRAVLDDESDEEDLKKEELFVRFLPLVLQIEMSFIWFLVLQLTW
jgi:hypothetical protein